MKNISKLLAMAAMILALASPAFAAQATKGTKSYQARAEKPSERQQAENGATADTDVSKIAPAAGEQADARQQSFEGKTMREDMQLPRKN